jgi:hypothetical protein
MLTIFIVVAVGVIFPGAGLRFLQIFYQPFLQRSHSSA